MSLSIPRLPLLPGPGIKQATGRVRRSTWVFDTKLPLGRTRTVGREHTVMFRNKPPTRAVQNTTNRGGGLIQEHHGSSSKNVEGPAGEDFRLPDGNAQNRMSALSSRHT
eukprot:128801-Rhodomonas_salina.1